MNSGKVCQVQSTPSRCAAAGMSSTASSVRIRMSWSSGWQGASVNPQLPMITEVTP